MKAPHDMRPRERIDEITDIIVEGLLRLIHKNVRKNKNLRVIPLDSSDDQSVHANTPAKRGKKHEE